MEACLKYLVQFVSMVTAKVRNYTVSVVIEFAKESNILNEIDINTNAMV